MKWFTTGAFALTLPVFACPDLSGVYKCTIEEGITETVEITQVKSNGVTVFLINGAEIPADNAAHAIVGDVTFQNASLRAWCEDDRLRTELIGNFLNNKTDIGSLDLITDRRRVGNAVLERAVGSMDNGLEKFPVKSFTSCILNERASRPTR